MTRAAGSGRRGGGGRPPGPFRRLARQPLRLAAVALLAVTALAASGVQSAAASALQSTLDEHWRGLYDLVVTPAGGIRAVDGLLPPNSLASVDGVGLTLDDLAAVRGTDGVEIAAPVGEIAVPGLKFAAPQVYLPRGLVDGAGEAPQAFRVRATYTTNDGLQDRAVAALDFTVVVDEATGSRWDGPDCRQIAQTFPGRNGEYEADPAQYPALAGRVCSFAAGAGDGVTVLGDTGTTTTVADASAPLEFTLPGAPQSTTRITLIDPVAERALLGDAGAFLDPLVDVHPSGELTSHDVAAWAEGRPASDEFVRRIRDAAEARTAAYTPTPERLAQLRDLYAAHGDDYDTWAAQEQQAVADDRAIPLLATSESAAQLSVKLDIAALGAAPVERTGAPDGSYAIPDGTDGTPVGTAVTDVSALVNPFAARTPGIAWPGAGLELADRTAPDWTAFEIGRVFTSGAGVLGDGDGVSLDASGFVAPQRESDDIVGTPAAQFLAADPAAPGTESAYTDVRDLWQSPFDGSSVVAVPIGAFDPDSLGLDADAAEYVPLGAYSPVGTTLADGPHAGATMLPSLSGLGLVSPRTVAIGSIDSAPIWGADAPISAIRVRVDGVDGYGPAAQRRVIEVAQAIDALGYRATIVAGSSPTDAGVHVDGYAFGTDDPDGAQHVGALGTVTQRWSELGAAARVSLSVSTATLAILGIALAAGILLLGAVQLAGVPGRRSQALVLREVGFTRPRIAGWFALEELPSLVVVAAAGAVAWWASGGTGIAAIAALAAVAAVLVTGIAAVVAGSRSRTTRRPRDARSRRLGARSVVVFGARQALVNPLASTVHLVAVVIVGLAAAALSATLLAARADAGGSSLALLVLGRQLGPQLGLGGVGIVAGMLLARLTRRLELERRGEQWATLRAAGWTGRQLAAAQRAEGLAVVVPALLATAALAWAGAWRLDLAPPWLYAAAAAAAGLAAALFALSTRRKGNA